MLPSFATGRLLLRPRAMADFDACIAMDRDPEVTKFIPGPWNEPEKHARFVRERIGESLGDGLGYWSIFPKDAPARFLGWILLIPCAGTGPEIEIGWRLTRAAWGQGYATEAATPILRHAFTTLHLPRVIADIHPANTASMRVAEKLGLRCMGDGNHAGIPCKTYALAAKDHA